MRSENNLFKSFIGFVLQTSYDHKVHTLSTIQMYFLPRAGKDLRVGENRTEGSPGESFFKVCQQAQPRPGSLRHRLASLCVAGNIDSSTYIDSP